MWRRGSLRTASAPAEFGIGRISFPGLEFGVLFEGSADAFGDDGRWRGGMGSFEKAGIEFDIGSGFLGQVEGERNFFALGRNFDERHGVWFTPYLGVWSGFELLWSSFDRGSNTFEPRPTTTAPCLVVVWFLIGRAPAARLLSNGKHVCAFASANVCAVVASDGAMAKNFCPPRRTKVCAGPLGPESRDAKPPGEARGRKRPSAD